MRSFIRAIVALGLAALVAVSCNDSKEVVPVAVQSVTLSQPSLGIAPGTVSVLTATVLPENAGNKKLLWTSSNSSVATVVEGVVTGVSEGISIVTATSEDGNKSDFCLVTVSVVHVESVAFSSNSMVLSEGGDPVALSCTVSPADAANKKVTVTSDNPAVAAYIGGMVIPISVGATCIRAKSEDGGKTASCVVIVNGSTPASVPVTGVTVSPSSSNINVGGSCTLVATVAPSNATNKNVVWTSGNESVATVSNGVVTGLSAGSAVITVTTVDGGKTATCNVTVNSSVIPVTGVSLTPTTLTVKKGESSTLTASVSPSNASNRNVSWSSGNSSVATVSNGVVRGVAAGSTTITVTTADGGKTASCSVNVVEAGEYPVGVTVVQNAAENYAYAIIDFAANPNLRFNVSFVDGGAQLSNHFSNFKTRYPSKGTPIIMTNADFFFTWDSYKYSCDLVQTGGQMKRYPCFSDGNGYYPVRSTIGRNSDGTFEINWVRGGSDDGYNPNYWSLYKYNAPVKYTSVADAEAGARTWWWPEEAVGGGPRIVKAGKNTAKYYYDLECCSFSGGTSDTYKTAKTMYGFRADGAMVILVEWYLTLAQGADRMIELGCVDAINFDGGGSSEMLGPGGKKLQAQTDASERYMPSAICISQL